MEALVFEVRQLREQIERLTEELSARDARVAEPEKLLEDSRRSGKRQAAPFFKGGPAEEPKRPGRRSGKDHGRHGHRAAPVGPFDRELSAPLPSCCPECGGALVRERDDEQFQCKLPDSRLVVTRFTVGVGRCQRCKKRVQGRHPEQTSDALGAAASQSGPHARSLATWLHYALGLSFQKTSQVLSHLGVPVTAGALSAGAQATGTDLVAVQHAIVKRINGAPMVVMDETGWRVGGMGAWLWVATSKDATTYNVADGRGFEEATELLYEDYAGTLVRDGWVVYRNYEKADHQTCVGHLLLRDWPRRRSTGSSPRCAASIASPTSAGGSARTPPSTCAARPPHRPPARRARSPVAELKPETKVLRGAASGNGRPCRRRRPPGRHRVARARRTRSTRAWTCGRGRRADCSRAPTLSAASRER